MKHAKKVYTRQENLQIASTGYIFAHIVTFVPKFYKNDKY